VDDTVVARRSVSPADISNMQTLTRPKAVLGRPIDPSKDIEQQQEERLRAVFSFYGVQWGATNCQFDLILRMIEERFPKAFQTKSVSPDKRVKVKNAVPLKQLVDAMIAGTEDGLADDRLRMIGVKVRRWLTARDKKATQRNLCEAISRLDTGVWKGIAPETLRDALKRPLGSPAKSKQLAQRRARRFRTALVRVARSLAGSPDDDDDFEPHP
jgi:hypothetical protein